MVERRIDQAAAAMGGEVIAGAPEARFRGAAIDSRRIAGGELFFALAGERTDGHEFVAAAEAAGAAASVVHREPAVSSEAVSSEAPSSETPSSETPSSETPSSETPARIRVADTYRALHELTRAVRRQVPERLVAITGSAGKTTTKELLAAMLARRFRVAKSLGNLNNLYGFPLSLLNIPDDSEWMVAEMGMSTPGELAEISRLGRPDAAVFTNVRPVHLESFPNLDGIAEAKAELLAGLAPDGLVVANAEDPRTLRIAARHRGRVVRFGLGPEAEVQARDVRVLEERPGSAFRLAAAGREVAVELPLHGSFNVENCLAAAAAAHALGVPLEEIAAAAAQVTPAPMRGQVHRLPSGGMLIDDAYNSNPDAAVKALESAVRLPGRRHVALLGDMLELGPRGPEFHAEVGERAAALGIGLLAGVGELSAETVRAARAAGLRSEHLVDAAAAAAWLEEVIRPGDVVLVKGSRGVGLEAVVRAALRSAGLKEAG